MRFAWPRWWRSTTAKTPESGKTSEQASPLLDVPRGHVFVAEPPDMEDSRSSVWEIHWSAADIDLAKALELAVQHTGKPVLTVEARVHEIEESLETARECIKFAEENAAAYKKATEPKTVE